MNRRFVFLISAALALLLLVASATGCTEEGSSDPMMATEVEVPLFDAEGRINLEIIISKGTLKIAPGAEDFLVKGSMRYNLAEFRPEIVIFQQKNVRIAQQEWSGLVGLTTGEAINNVDLTLAAELMNLRVKTTDTESTLDLGGLALANALIQQGASDMDLTFSAPNQVPMGELVFEAGTTSAQLTNLANTNAESINFTGGAGTYMLDFGGKLQRDMQVELDAGVSDVVITVPEEHAARLTFAGETGDTSNVSTSGAWEQSSNAYVLAGSGPTITITTKMGIGSLELRTDTAQPEE